MFNFPMLMLKGVFTPPADHGSGFILGWLRSGGPYVLELDFSSGSYSYSTQSPASGELPQVLAHGGRGVCDKAGGSGYVLGGFSELPSHNAVFKKFTKSSKTISIITKTAGSIDNAYKVPMESSEAGYSGLGASYTSTFDSNFFRIAFSSASQSSFSSGLDVESYDSRHSVGFSSSSHGFIASLGYTTPNYFKKMDFSNDSFSLSSSVVIGGDDVTAHPPLFDKAIGKAVLTTGYSSLSYFYSAGTFNMSSETYGTITSSAINGVALQSSRCGGVRDSVNNAGIFVNDNNGNARRYSFGTDTFSDQTGYYGRLPETIGSRSTHEGLSCGID